MGRDVFDIFELRLWPSKGDERARCIPIKPGCVNYIWSAPRTGKSNFWPILDFVLGANRSRAPIGQIATAICWYEIVLAKSKELGGGLQGFARTSDGKHASVRDIFDLGSSPNTPPTPNTSLGDYISALSRTCDDLPETPLGLISTRDLTLLCNLPQYAIGDPTSFIRPADRTFSALKISYALQYLLQGDAFDLRKFTAFEGRQQRRLREIRASWALIEGEYERLHAAANSLGVLGDEPPPVGFRLSEYGLRQLARAAKSLSYQRIVNSGLAEKYTDHPPLATYELGVLAGRISEFNRVAGALLSEIQKRDGEFLERIRPDNLSERFPEFTKFAPHFSDALKVCAEAMKLDKLPGDIEIRPEDFSIHFRSGSETKPLLALGGQANYVGYNISTLISLHVAFRKVGFKEVPPVLIIDQPTQAFVSNSTDAAPNHSSDDISEKLLALYSALDELASNLEDAPTIIVLERMPPPAVDVHKARSSVESWSAEDSGLIPNHWL